MLNVVAVRVLSSFRYCTVQYSYSVCLLSLCVAPSLGENELHRTDVH